MAAVLGITLLALVISLIFNYHVILLVDGRMSMSDSSSQEEDLQLEAQLKSLNKPPTKTIYADWGDVYDCIEFRKQHAFDHPMIKKYKILIELPVQSNKTLPIGIIGCPKGTVPIRRTTKQDLIRARSLSPLSSSGSHGDTQYRAGVSLARIGKTFYGGGGAVNIWNPKVEKDQFSSAEIALKSGPDEQVNGIKFGWMVNPQLYGDNLTRAFVYWTGDGGHRTGCYNTLCPGYVQVNPKYTPDLPYWDISIAGSTQYEAKIEISLERETGRWWLILEDEIKMGYWPNVLFPLFMPGVDYIYWGGRVKSGKNGALPPMCSGQFPGPNPETTGYFAELTYKDKNDRILKPDMLEYTNDCKKLYSAKYHVGDNQMHFGGTGGDAGSCYI